MSQDIKQTFVRIGDNEHGVPSVIYEPVNLGEKALIGVVVMHGQDYLNHTAGPQLAKRGYRVICANPVHNQSYLSRMQDVNDVVSHIRNYPEVRHVVVFGHSGGGGLMSSYQRTAENPDSLNDSKRILPLRDVPKMDIPDGIILPDCNWGCMSLLSVDPAVLDESTGQKIDPELDLFSPENGFSEHGSNYSEAFIKKYLKAQGERNNKIIERALERLEIIRNGKGAYLDDEPFVVPGSNGIAWNNKLFPQDVRLFSHTKEPRKLLHKDGKTTTEIVRCLRKTKNIKTKTPYLDQGAINTTVCKYLSTIAVRALPDYGYGEDSLIGVDWSSSNSCGPENVKYIRAPLLAMGMTAGYEYLTAETIYENAASEDKDIAFVEGATHTFIPDKECEEYPGQFGDVQQTLYDYIDSWLAKPGRFI